MVYYILLHIYHTCNTTYLWIIHISHIPLCIWNILFATFRICYLNADNNNKLNFFSLSSLFHPIFSLVYQGSHLRWWYSTPHIFHHLFMPLLYLHSMPISSNNICRFFSTQYLKDQSAYLKGQEYPQATRPWMFLINSSLSQYLTSGFSNASKSV